MDIHKAIQAEHEKNLIGWDRSTVVEIIGRSINLLNESTAAVESHLATWKQKVDHDFDETWDRVASVGLALHAEVQKANSQRVQSYDVLKRHYAESAQLRKAIDEMSNLIIGSPQEIIKLAKDLTTIADKLLSMNDKVAASFPEVGSKESDEYLSYLSAEQAFQVMQWVEEEKERRSTEKVGH